MILELKHIFKSYGNPQQSNFRKVIEDLNLEVYANQKIAIAGPSGSGKTTLLNLIGTLDQPDAGEIIFKGMNITGYSQKELAYFRNQELGFVFQMHHLLPQCTVWENVLLPTCQSKEWQASRKRIGQNICSGKSEYGSSGTKNHRCFQEVNVSGLL